MTDIIQLLPDSVANQIAAGEVIQRPASVVKELVENGIDSGASEITIILKDSGRTLIQVIDNGKGMSETDARLAFERHATSKITEAKDLFAISTKGFRGEALASIAAIANVELKTKLEENELGTNILIKGSTVEKQEPISCPRGSNFQIKNLFYNTPARRKFLKTDSTELKHIINEFNRVALAHPEIGFIFKNNNTEVFNIPASNKHQRIIHIFGRSKDQNLVSLKTDTTLVKISGFVGKPEFARKTGGEQFFFVNDRYIRHSYFHKAILNAYDKILHPQAYPSYFIYFDVDPETIDINIHPTKTEIKFENERALFQIIEATVKESLGKFNIVPSIDFDQEPIFNTSSTHGQDIKQPEIQIDPTYNPFEQSSPASGSNHTSPKKTKIDPAWEDLYKTFESNDAPSIEPIPEPDTQSSIEIDSAVEEVKAKFTQLRFKYISTPVKSGIMLIDQKRAHERIIYEILKNMQENSNGVTQKMLFPENFDLDENDSNTLNEIIDDIRSLGFDIDSFGKNSFVINGTPADVDCSSPVSLIEKILDDFKETNTNIKLEPREKLMQSLSKYSSINYGKQLKYEEMQNLFNTLFACSSPNYAPDGKSIIQIISFDEIDGKFN